MSEVVALPSSSRRHPVQAAAQVFARDLRLPENSPLVFLPRGGANAVRPDVQAGHLVCPIGGCGDPRFIVRGGSKRDGFAHRPGEGNHAPESVAHHTSKHLIAAWLREQYPDAQVFPDTQNVENGQRPDVKLILASGKVIAYEVQFAQMDAELWQHRHDGYASLGIRDVWLFGGRHYDRPPRGTRTADSRVPVHPVFRAVLSSRHPMLFINPDEQTVALGTGAMVSELLTARGLAPHRAFLERHDGTANVNHRIPIPDAASAGGVIDLPGERELMNRTATAHDKWVARQDEEARWDERARASQCTSDVARHEADAKRDAAQVAERAAAASRREVDAAQLVSDRDARRQQMIAIEASQRAVQRRRTLQWASTRAAIEAGRGPLPGIVDMSPSSREALVTTKAPAQWRWDVLQALEVHVGYTVDPTGLTDFMTLDSRATTDACAYLLDEYLRVLRQEGWVWFWGPLGPDTREAVTVCAAPHNPPVVAPLPATLQLFNGRMVGPGPNGHQGLAGKNSARRGNARRVGYGVRNLAHDEAIGMQVALATQVARSAPAVPAPGVLFPSTPDFEGDASSREWKAFSALVARYPGFRRWSAAQSWPTWGYLPDRLHGAARMTTYLACELSVAGPIVYLSLAGFTGDDTTQILEALQRARYITVDEYAPGLRRWKTIDPTVSSDLA